MYTSEEMRSGLQYMFLFFSLSAPVPQCLHKEACCYVNTICMIGTSHSHITDAASQWIRTLGTWLPKKRL